MIAISSFGLTSSAAEVSSYVDSLSVLTVTLVSCLILLAVFAIVSLRLVLVSSLEDPTCSAMPPETLASTNL